MQYNKNIILGAIGFLTLGTLIANPTRINNPEAQQHLLAAASPEDANQSIRQKIAHTVVDPLIRMEEAIENWYEELPLEKKQLLQTGALSLLTESAGLGAKYGYDDDEQHLKLGAFVIAKGAGKVPASYIENMRFSKELFKRFSSSARILLCAVPYGTVRLVETLLDSFNLRNSPALGYQLSGSLMQVTATEVAKKTGLIPNTDKFEVGTQAGSALNNANDSKVGLLAKVRNLLPNRSAHEKTLSPSAEGFKSMTAAELAVLKPAPTNTFKKYTGLAGTNIGIWLAGITATIGGDSDPKFAALAASIFAGNQKKLFEKFPMAAQLGIHATPAALIYLVKYLIAPQSIFFTGLSYNALMSAIALIKVGSEGLHKWASAAREAMKKDNRGDEENAFDPGFLRAQANLKTTIELIAAHATAYSVGIGAAYSEEEILAGLVAGECAMNQAYLGLETQRWYKLLTAHWSPALPLYLITFFATGYVPESAKTVLGALSYNALLEVIAGITAMVKKGQHHMHGHSDHNHTHDFAVQVDETELAQPDTSFNDQIEIELPLINEKKKKDSPQKMSPEELC